MCMAGEQGHRVVLVTCTRGEEGKINNMDETGTDSNNNPTSFHMAPLSEAAARAAAIMREEKPDVVVIYSADATYGHPTTSRPIRQRWRRLSCPPMRGTPRRRRRR